jgi:hypothetical protein
MKHITITPEKYTGKDIDDINDIICGIIAECHGEVVESLSFSIEVSYTSVEEDAA